MNSPYTIHIKTPSGEARIGADTWEGLTGLMPDALKQADPGRSQDKEFEARLNAFYSDYKKRFSINEKAYTPIAIHGLETDIAACFLHRMTIKQTIEWLVSNKNIRCSKSAIGRYWTRFISLGHKRELLSKC